MKESKYSVNSFFKLEIKAKRRRSKLLHFYDPCGLHMSIADLLDFFQRIVLGQKFDREDFFRFF